jgi:hypothetical protein
MQRYGQEDDETEGAESRKYRSKHGYELDGFVILVHGVKGTTSQGAPCVEDS